MQYRKLGKTNIEVSTVAMGCWAIVGDWTWGPQNQSDAIDAIVTALDIGITFFDTAPSYGDSASEKLLGKALGKRRGEAVLATKVSPCQLKPDDLVRSCETSLGYLGTDYIDLLQVHWPNWNVPFVDVFRTMERLKEQGKIRAIGVSNFGPHDLGQAVKLTDVIANQMGYSLLARQLEYEVQPLCVDHGVSILPYSPLAQGLLTGKFASADEVPESRSCTRHFDAGKRARTRHGEGGCEAETFAAIAQVRQVTERLDRPMAEISLAWLLHQPAVASVVAGARNPAQVKQNAAAGDLQLDDQTLAALNAATAPVKQALGDNLDLWQPQSNSRIR